MAELTVSIEDATMVPRLRRVIRSLHGVSRVSTHTKKKVVRSNSAYLHQLARLKELAALPDDWDDDGAVPIEQQVILSR